MNELLSPIALMQAHRDIPYVRFVRDQPCCVSGAQSCLVGHHVRMFGGGGTGQKPSDYLVVPLRADLHGELHSLGEAAFWLKVGVDPIAVIERQLEQCIQPGTLDEINNSLTASWGSNGRVRALIEAVATWRQAK